MWTIAKAGIRECVRYRVLYFMTAMAVLFIFMGRGCNPGTIKGEGILFDREGLQSMALGVAFHGIAFWSLLLCGLLSSTVLQRELEDGTAVLPLSRPISRAEFLAGKMISVLTVSCLNMALLGILFAALYYREVGSINFRLAYAFAVMMLSLLMFALMSMCASLVLPRMAAPLVCLIVYLTSMWNSIPFYYEKVRIIWEPSDTVYLIYRCLPRFGDLQFSGAALISDAATFSKLQGPLAWSGLYCAFFWFVMVALFKRRPI